MVSHPAFRFLGREKHEVMKALFVSGPVAPQRASALSHPLPLPLGGGGARRAILGPRFPELREELVTFISSSAALRHAGCSWLDVARHASFHACVRARVVAGGYSVYLATVVKHPFVTAIATSVTKCVASDVFVQKVVEGREELDARRVFCFFTLGLTYVGAFQYGLYNRLMKPAGAALAKRAGVGASVGFLVAVDQFLVCPLFYLPAFSGSRAGPGASATPSPCPRGWRRRAGRRSPPARARRGASGAASPSSRAAGRRGRRRRVAHAGGAVGVLGAGAGGELLGRAAPPHDPLHERHGLRLERDHVRDERREARGASPGAPAAPATAPAMEACLADERCVRALTLASGDALAIAAIGVARGIDDDNSF